uniref:Uncharacterized protein n=1 Tax=Chaetoceros debilis TaxID=122233 RepID=A0A7S3QE60_9STRA
MLKKQLLRILKSYVMAEAILMERKMDETLKEDNRLHQSRSRGSCMADCHDNFRLQSSLDMIQSNLDIPRLAKDEDNHHHHIHTALSYMVKIHPRNKPHCLENLDIQLCSRRIFLSERKGGNLLRQIRSFLYNKVREDYRNGPIVSGYSTIQCM